MIEMFPYDGNVKTTEAAAQVLHNLLDRSPVEQLIVVYLNSGSEIIGVKRRAWAEWSKSTLIPRKFFVGLL